MRTLASTFHFAPPVDVVRCALTKGFTSGSIGLPVLPEIAGRVIALANDQHASIADMCALIEQDQALAANILRYANSAAFAAGQPVTSLHEAMMRMGMTMVSGLAVAACLEGKAFAAPAYDACRRRVRAHALLTAGIARDLARACRANVDLVFMCALLHSIGKPVVLRLLVDVQKSAHVTINEEDAEILAHEYETEAATTAVKAWNLPRPVQIVAVHYRRASAAPEWVRETTIAGLASRMAAQVIAGTAAPPAEVLAWPETTALELDGVAIGELIAKAQRIHAASLRDVI